MVKKQTETLQALENAGRMMKMQDSNTLYHLSVENANQRKLDAVLYYVKLWLTLDCGSNTRGWLLLALILSAQKWFVDAEIIISTALDQTGKWDQAELLRSKAKFQIAQGQLKGSVETYTQLLAILQVQSKTFGSGKKQHEINGNPAKYLELEVWQDLASVYIGLSRWQDAEIFLSRSMAIIPYSAARYHITGILNEAKGLYREALKVYRSALNPPTFQAWCPQLSFLDGPITSRMK